MRDLWKISVILCIAALKAAIANAQCISDDSIRSQIRIIYHDHVDYHSKIGRLTSLGTSYLKCHEKENAISAEIVHQIGACYCDSGDFEKGIAYTANALDINKHTGRAEPFLCNNYFNIGWSYEALNMPNHANEYFHRCINVGKRFTGKYYIVGMAYAELAYLLYKAGDYQQAVNIAAEGVHFSESANDAPTLASLYAQKTQSEVELGDFKQADKDISRSLSLLAGREGQELASSYAIYARFLRTNKKYQKSVIYFQKAFLLNEKLGNFSLCINNMTDLGNVYSVNLLQENKARNCYNMGLQIAQKNINSYQIAGLYENIAVTYWRQGSFNKALLYYQKALNALPINFSDKSVYNNPGIGTLNQVSNDYYVSNLLANKGESLLTLYSETGHKPLLIAALQTFILADRSVDMMRWKQQGELSKLLWRTKTKEMYRNAIEVCYLLNDAESGFYFFEKSRSVLLNDRLVSSLKISTVNDEKPVKKLQLKIDSLNRQLVSLKNNEPDGSLRAEWMAANREWENQQNQLLKAKYLGRDDLKGYSYRSVKMQQRQLLQSNQSLVEYFSDDSVVYTLLITPTKANIFKTRYATYRDDCDAFLKYCSNAGLLNQQYAQYINLANKLYRRLFQPLQIQTKRVIISPGDVFIPFDALQEDPKSDSSFLMKKHAFSYVYSMRVLMQRDPNTTLQTSFFLGIAPENYASSLHLQPLTSSWASLQHIEKGFNSSLILHGNDANKKNLLSSLPQFRVVQIYSHADADSSSTDPLLYMADSAVRLTEIQKLKLSHTELIVLSACNTGVGRTAIGEGIFSLSRGFRMAGIPSTVTNLWQADNQATYQLTESFYNYLKMGMPKDLALQKAKLGFLRDDKTNHSLPFYWAATIVLGDTAPLHAEVNSNNMLRISLLVCGMFFVLAIPLSIFLFKKKQSKR